MLTGDCKKIYFSVNYKIKKVINIDIESQIIHVKVNNFNENHFRSIGYICKNGDYIDIPVKDLPSGSGLKINVQCKYCGKIFKKAYRRYLETKDDVCCNECKKNKIMKVSLERYGNVCSLRNEIIQEKSKSKNLKNLGVQYPFQNKGILEKCRKTCVEKYGEKYREKTISKQQRHIHYLYGGLLNYNEFPFVLDIFFPDDLIYFEYDGSGHDLSVKMGIYTRKEFEEREKKREKFLREKGYKEFRIVSNNDILPDDNKLLEIKNRAFDFLLNNIYNKYIYNLNTKIESFEV